MVTQLALPPTPLYPVPASHRLGWLVGQENVVGADGVRHRLVAEIVERKHTEPRSELDPVSGSALDVRVQRKRKALSITLDDGEPWIEGEHDLESLAGRLVLPDPGDVATAMPERHRQAMATLDAVAAEHGFKLKDFQRDDVSRLLCVGSGLLAASMGLGKTVQALAYAAALTRMGRMPDQALFVVPQDILPQWKREAWRFFHRRLRVIVDPASALRELHDARAGKRLSHALPETPREAADAVRRGEAGWWITHYEMLSRNGAGRTWSEPQDGQGPLLLLRIKPGYAALTTAFRRSLIVIDEATKFKGDDSQMSLAVRALKARFRLALTGTPVKNFVEDAFWILWWVLGSHSPRFPYGYEDKDRFREDFGVRERVKRPGDTKWTPRSCPDISNVHSLWRLLAPAVVRRTMLDAGEDIVRCDYVPVSVPFGVRQRQQYEAWLDRQNFAAHFLRKFPRCGQSPTVIARMAAAYGQLWRLEYASTCPAAEVEHDHDPPAGTSNFTPKLCKALDLCLQHVQRGERVLVGSDLVATGVWLAERLQERGVRALHITDEGTDGRPVTIGPKRRADAVADFLAGEAQVLCTGIGAMSLGHNLDVASTVILVGLPYDYSTLEQFLARVRRLTSTRPISVYVVMTDGSLDERKWRLLTDKAAAASWAIDGRALLRDELPVSPQQFLDELIAQGLPAAGGEVDEAMLEAVWRSGQVLQLASTTRPKLPASRDHATLADIAAALTSGYTLHFEDGSVAGIDPDSEYVALMRQGRVVLLGDAFAVAQAIAGMPVLARFIVEHRSEAQQHVAAFFPAENDRFFGPADRERYTALGQFSVPSYAPRATEQALRHARMSEEARERRLRWWPLGSYEWLPKRLQPAPPPWWTSGPYTWELPWWTRGPYQWTLAADAHP